MNLRPLGRRVFVEPVYDELVTPSGLWLAPHTSLSPDGLVLHQTHNPLYANQGIVVAVPDTNGGRPLEVALNDFVIFSPYSASLVKTADLTLVAIDEAEILAVVEPEEKPDAREVQSQSRNRGRTPRRTQSRAQGRAQGRAQNRHRGRSWR